MSVRMRHTRSHTKNRRSHHAIETERLSKCAKCGANHLRHRMCENCGTYRGKVVVDVMAKLSKKERKTKEKELAHEEAHGGKEKNLDAAALSQK